MDCAQGGPGATGGGTGGLAHLLLNSYQERLIQNRLQEEQEREECTQEEEEEDEGEAEVTRYKTGNAQNTKYTRVKTVCLWI